MQNFAFFGNIPEEWVNNRSIKVNYFSTKNSNSNVIVLRNKSRLLMYNIIMLLYNIFQTGILAINIRKKIPNCNSMKFFDTTGNIQTKIISR